MPLDMTKYNQNSVLTKDSNIQFTHTGNRTLQDGIQLVIAIMGMTIGEIEKRKVDLQKLINSVKSDIGMCEIMDLVLILVDQLNPSPSNVSTYDIDFDGIDKVNVVAISESIPKPCLHDVMGIVSALDDTIGTRVDVAVSDWSSPPWNMCVGQTTMTISKSVKPGGSIYIKQTGYKGPTHLMSGGDYRQDHLWASTSLWDKMCGEVTYDISSPLCRSI
tara:strand:+ start:349 stop:1002 length:654 start_codon:yes stop_codon:yes gene_type:complete